MLMSIIPMSVLTVEAAPSSESIDVGDYTDIDMDFNYPYTDPMEVLKNNADQRHIYPGSKDNISVKWKHADSFGPKSGTLRSLLQSTSDSDKYIIVDNDLTTTSGHTDYETIVIKSDKVLDLNGHLIRLMDKRNKVDTHDDYHDSYYQSDNSADFQSVMFSIQSGATLTIIDSSAGQTGEIYINAYMIDPYKHRIKRYTTRDIFNVDDGNLVIYGGTYQAGRSKAQSDDDLFNKIETVVGNAVALATDIAGYATGINAATGAYEDAVFNAKQAMDAIKKAGGNQDGDESAKSQTAATTAKKTGEDAKPEPKKDSPDGKENSDAARNKTVGEKQDDKDKNKKNESNARGSAQYDGNSKIAAAENAITDAATNKDKIGAMVSSAFNLAKSIKSCFETDEGSIVTQSFLGTVVNVGNGGTFVSYGGNYIGHGMTPNIRNGVIEATQKGKVYIFDGLFEGRCGANIFNIVKYNNSLQAATQYVEDTKGNVTEKSVSMRTDETNGLEVLTMVNKTDANGNVVYENGSPVKVPVDTSNIRVRGGTFRCYYEATMLGLNKDTSDGANDHNTDQMTMFPGSAGGVNLGVESYNEDLIRDGRIQLVDTYGDGALVLMDDNKDAGDKSIFHYRLFCTDEELRKNRYLTVYPNEPGSNSTFSFSLQTRYDSQDTGTYEDISTAWSDSSENDRGVFSSDEKFFTYPINDKNLSEKYYVIPYMTNTDVFGRDLDASEVWYYNTPVDTRGRKIDGFEYSYGAVRGTVKDKNGDTSTVIKYQQYLSDSEWNKVEKQFITGSSYAMEFLKNYRNNVKWITYKVYRVDPLTRLNITDTFGVDQPVVTVRYGAASNNALKCRLPLNELGINYQAGEMYRIVMSVDEYLSYNGTSKILDKASCESSIVFVCYDTDEYKIENNQKTEDYTPVQWLNEPRSGSVAKVQIINGQAGLIDYMKRKIFDVYYQWYEVNPDGDDILIAGTDNIFTGKLDTFTADLNGLKNHTIRKMLPGKDGYTYVNTVDPNDPNSALYGENGLPADTSKWTVEMLHSYLEGDTPLSAITKNSALPLSPSNNRTMATNTDSCYIPESCEGKTIYCKVTAVNSFWLRNFDHVQVFYSHPVKVPIETKPLVVSLSAEYEGSYATIDNPVNISITDIKGLDPDEKITKVVYRTKNGRNWSKTFDNISVTNASSVKSIAFPKDFDDKPYGVDSVGACPALQVFAEVYTNKDRRAKTNVEVVDFEAEAKDISFKYNDYYFYEGIYHHINDPFVDEVSLKVTPPYASVGFSLTNGGSFTSSDPDVATFDEKGDLIPGTKEGRTTITLNLPDGSTKSLVYANPIQQLDISGIDAPVIGQKFDLTGDVPEGANYTVKEIYWTEGKYGDRLPADAVAEAFRSYTAHAVIQEKPGYEFMTDEYAYWIGDTYGHYANTPYTLTATLSDGTEDTISGILTGDDSHVWKADRQNTIEASYSFPASTGGMKDVIDTIVINYPTDVRQGDSIDEWKKQFEIITGAEGTYTTKIFAGTEVRSEDLWEAIGYVSAPDVFLCGSQTGFSVQLRLDDQLSVTFPSDTSSIKVIINGEEVTDAEKMGTTKYLAISAYNCINITEGSRIRPFPVFNIDCLNMVVGESINLSDIITSNVPDLEFRLGEEDQSNEYFDYYAETNKLVTKKAAPTDYRPLQGYVLWDTDGDGIKETKILRSIKLDIYDSEDDLPEDDNARITFKALDPDGNQVYSINRYVTHENTDDKYSALQYFSVPEISNAVITRIESSLGEYNKTNPEVSYRYGVNRLNTSMVRSNRTYTIHTAAADSIKIYPGKDRVYAAFDGEPEGIMLSIDNDIFYAGGYIDGLEPDTEYTLYYRQGVDGTVYSKQFRTANTEYGVTVGKNIVTDKNQGNLERDGWHYDTSSNTLTLKDCTILSSGILSEVEKFVGYEVKVMSGAISSQHDLTVELIGENNITKLKGSALTDVGIYADGDITLTGNGDLHLSGYTQESIQSTGIYSAGGNIYLKSNGTVSFDKFASGIDINYSNRNTKAAYYYSGEYYFTPIYMTNYSTPFYNGSLYNYNYTFDINNKTHTIKVYTGENGFDETLASDGNEVTALTANSAFIHIVPIHTCTKKVISAEYYVEGNCEEGAVYYKSCSCGYTDKKSTFIVSGQDHSYTYCDAKQPTCTEDGWKAYKVCEKCGDTDFEVVPSSGHQLVHHDAKDPSCSESGWDAYDVCSVCGMTTYHEIPPTGHELIHHEGQDATCTEPGWLPYDTCKNCSYTTYTEIPAKGHNLVHHDGKSATSSESGWEPYDECTDCDYSTFKVIPAQKALENKSSVSASSVTAGTAVTLTAKAEGGTAPYRYSYEYKKSSSSSWTSISSGYCDYTSAVFTPSMAAAYIVRIRVKDSKNTVVEKQFTITSVKALANNSTISSDKPTVGSNVTLNGAASGGSSPYKYAFYYKKASSKYWTTIGTAFGSDTTASFKVGSTGDYIAKVTVKDNSGATADKEFSITSTTASTELANKSSVSTTTIPKDTAVLVKGAASGGQGDYRYSFYYKKSTSAAWISLGELYGNTKEVTFVPAAIAKYLVKVNVKDSTGKVVTKQFTVNSVKPSSSDLVNTSTLDKMTVVKNNPIKITASAKGGSGGYKYAFYYKKTTSKAFTAIGTEYGSAASAVFTPASKAEYNVRLNVMDSNGTLVVKQYKITSTAE